MDKKIEETREFLQTIGMPKAQQADICCYVILAMAGVKPDMSWSEATNEWIRIHDIIQFVNAFYGMSYAENSRETFRKQALHRFRTAALIEDNGTATNSPNYRYRLTEETVQILRTMGTPKWGESIKRFLCYHEKLIDLYASILCVLEAVSFLLLIRPEMAFELILKGILFLFCGRRTDRIKGLVWEGDGFLLLYKRLELGAFNWPRTKEEALEITPEQYQYLMQGLEIVARHPIQEVRPDKILSSSPETAARQLLLSHRFQYPDGISFLGIPPTQMPA